jgi:membrane-bound serine protease (ClpP class)
MPHRSLLKVTRHVFWWFLLVAAASVLWLGAAANEERRQAFLFTIADAIGPATADYIIRGIERAEAEDAELVILQLDTPGGLDSAMRDIVKAFLASNVPVVTYVHPAGARAASAGTYMLYGSHVAAMTPATNLGSATPVQMGGGGLPGLGDPPARPTGQQDSGGGAEADAETPKDIVAAAASTTGAEPVEPVEPDSQAVQADPADTDAETAPKDADAPRRGETAMERKVLEDAVSFIRGLAERFDRNADWAEEAVREGSSLTARAALELNVIDFVAVDLEDLLQQMDGHIVRLASGDRALATADLEIVRVDPDWRTRLLAVITSPNVAYILMLVGIYGIIFELSNPGSIYPGVIGAISLVLAFYALQVMPVNFAGLALILLGLVFMIAEAFVPSFGILGIGGMIAFVTGSIILWDDPDLNVSIPLIVATAAVVAVFSLWVLGRLMRIRRVKPTIGGEDELVGMIGEARQDFVGKGQIFVNSEIWNADVSKPVKRGQKVRVMGKDGLRLKVEAVPDT